MKSHLENNMSGKRALVTGAGSGIGRATALLLAQSGAEVVLLGRTEDELAAVTDELGGSAAGHHQIIADISSETEMIDAFGSVLQFWDSLDVLVANAGVNGVWAPLDKLELSEWDETLTINLRGTFLTVKHALPLLKKHGGSVIVVSSINGTRIFSNSGATAYACSKAAQVAFARMTALELAKDGIRVNSICPGAIETNIDDSTERRDIESLHLPVEFPAGDIPLTWGRPGAAMDVAQAIVFLASDAARHISGTEIYVDGAQSLLQG
jgi:NAD(P)-dependent dehydrogenase (short-subunit alcohol dehydrogenase family)